MGDPVSFGVVVPAYNAAQFLPRSLASIKRQTYAPRRIIVVDDGSRDASADVARRLGVEVVQRPNGGASAARNTGVAALETEWIAFLDADDTWEPSALERLAAAIRACPDVDVAFGDYTLDEEISRVPSWFAQDRDYAAIQRRAVAPGIVRCERDSLVEAVVRSTSACVSMSSLAVRRNAFQAVGGFDEGLLVAEDLELLLRLFTRSTAVVVEEVLSTYYRHGENLSDDATANVAWELRVLERIAAHPERYPGGTGDLLVTQRPKRLARAGAYALRSGRFADARAWYERSWSARSSPGAASGMAAALLLNNPAGRALHGVLRTAWRGARRSLS